MKPAVSVIVPVFNVEHYLSDCLESLTRQTLAEIEIICVNDGSTDHSLEILERFQHQDGRILIINKENTGYGDSVNQGIRLASGHYIGIVESDDFVSAEMYETLYRTALANDVEVVKSNYKLYFTDTHEVELHNTFGAVPCGKILTEEEKENVFFSAPAVWSGIYKRDFLLENKISFTETEGASYQDTAFAFKVILCAKRVVALQDAFLFYRQDNEHSSIHDSDKVFCICNEINAILEFLFETGNQDKMPIFVKNKYIRYKWNLDRLEGESRQRFFVKMYQEFRRDCFNGYLIKKYWSNSEWDDVHRIIFAPLEYLKNESEVIYENAFIEENMALLISMLKSCTGISIYGAGRHGKRLLKALARKGILPETIVVTNKEEQDNMIDGVPVIDLEECRKRCKNNIFLLGVSEKYKQEILEIGARNNLNNFLEIEGNFLDFLEKEGNK